MPRPIGRPSQLASWVRTQPEVFLSRREIASRVRRAANAGLIRQLSRGLYTRNLSTPPEELVRRNLWTALSLAFDEPVVLHGRTALTMRPTETGDVWLTASGIARPGKITWPGHTIHLIPGRGPEPQDAVYLGRLHLPSEARLLVENMQPSRARRGAARTASRQELEDKLETILTIRGEDGLNQVRDAAREVGVRLGLVRESQALEQVIGAILGTRAATLTSARVLARQRGLPCDPAALTRLEALAAELVTYTDPRLAETAATGRGWDIIAFFDAYFSNFIEGTEFEIEEAEAIVFEGRIPAGRPEDAHDIAGTFHVVADQTVMRRSLATVSSEVFLEELQTIHRSIMRGRAEVLPGEFKLKVNRAGSTTFVEPDLVRGTLIAMHERLRNLPAGFPRAAATLFAISEVHPFNDGNGRVSRALMNAELLAAGRSRIIIPTVYREDYLGALRRLSRDLDPTVLPPMLVRAQRWVTAMPWDDRARLTTALEDSHALLPDRGRRLWLPGEPGYGLRA